MKTFLTAALVLLLALIWFNRERVYLRDPLATVTLDTAPQSGIQVFINGSYDILLEKDDAPNPYRLLIQHSNPIPGTPTLLRCLRWTACLTESAQPPTIPLASTSPATMTDRETSFTTPEGTRLRVTLR
ncbi:MAG TPA: hypothetical protein VGU23_05715 [Acidobacteriaceae bacterium]|nr:hypothetical protein [Acidobacteriaceae bacterium]